MNSSEFVKQFGCNTASVAPYLFDLIGGEDPVYNEIRTRALYHGLPQISVGPFDVKILELISRLHAPGLVVEIGTLAGLSTVALSKGLKKGGKIYTLEADGKHADVARITFKRHELEKKITLMQGLALELLPNLESVGPFDIVFIDADKPAYPKYLQWAQNNLKQNGLLIADNVFAWGMIHPNSIVPDQDAHHVQALRQFNKDLVLSDQFIPTFIPTGEGLVVAQKK